MQSDEVVWQIINQNFCSFKAKLPSRVQNFCRHPYNVTGLCNRSSCPLANSRYATVKEEDGICYLYIKTIERSHMPNRQWEKIKLKANYLQALDQIDEHLKYWPNFLRHKNKQRLTKLRQMLIRMRKLERRHQKQLVPINRKQDRRERKNEAKAERAAELESAVKQELLDRLKKGTYEGIYNLSSAFEKVLDEEGAVGDKDRKGFDDSSAAAAAAAGGKDEDDSEADSDEEEESDSSEDDGYDYGTEESEGPEEEIEYVDDDDFVADLDSDDEFVEGGAGADVEDGGRTGGSSSSAAAAAAAAAAAGGDDRRKGTAAAAPAPRSSSFRRGKRRHVELEEEREDDHPQQQQQQEQQQTQQHSRRRRG